MLIKSTAILLKKVKYGERNLILQCYTREQGSKSFFLNVPKSKGKLKIHLPSLSIVDVVASKGKGDLFRIKEIQLKQKNYNLTSDIQKASIVMFLNEVLAKSIKEYQVDENLFDFICNSMEYLDEIGSSYANFHIKFMLELSSHMGFYPNGQYSEQKPYFDLYEGLFSESRPLHKTLIEAPLSKVFGDLLMSDKMNPEEIKMTNQQRREILSALLDYYRIHVEKFDDIKTREVLETVFS